MFASPHQAGSPLDQTDADDPDQGPAASVSRKLGTDTVVGGVIGVVWGLGMEIAKDAWR